MFSFLFKKYTAEQQQLSRFIKEKLGFKPNNIALYQEAFTHKSIIKYNPEKAPHNERLEFLGDTFLAIVITEYLFHNYPKQKEGQLSKMRSRLVSRAILNEIGEKLNFIEFIQYRKSNNPFRSLLGNTLEALIGAIYLDQGEKKAKTIVLEKIIKQYIDVNKVTSENRDYKSQLIIKCQKKQKQIKFDILQQFVNSEGDKRIEIGLFIDENLVMKAEDHNRRKAEQKAAKQLLELGINHIPDGEINQQSENII